MAATENRIITDANWNLIALGSNTENIIIPLGNDAVIEWSASLPPTGEDKGAIVPTCGMKVDYNVYVRYKRPPYEISITGV